MGNISLGLEINSQGADRTVADLRRVQSAVAGFKRGEQATRELAKLLGRSEAEARKLAKSLGLTETQVIEAAQAMNALKKAGASNEQTFKSLNQSLGISRRQFDALSRVNISPKGLKQLEKQTKGIGDGMEDLAGDTKKAGFSAVDLASKLFLVVQAFQALAAVAGPAYQLLIGQNEQVRQQLLGIQSTLAATNQVIVGGVEITDPTEAINALEGPVNDALDRIRQGSLELVGVTSSQLVDTFRIVATEAGGIGISLEQASDLTLDFAATLGTLGVPLDQAQQEIRSILQGTVDSNSIVAKSLGITNDQIKSLKEQGRLYEVLREKLGAFRAGNALAAQTVGGISSNIQELIEEFTRLSGQELTEDLVIGLNEVFVFLEKNKDAILEFTNSAVSAFSDIIKIVVEFGGQIGEDLADSFGFTGDAIAKLFDGLGSNLAGLATTIGLVVQTIVKNVGPTLDKTIGTLIRIIDLALEGFGRIDDLAAQFNGSTDAAIEYGKQTEKASNQALEALRLQEQGEESAADAKREAIAVIDEQILALKKSNVSGAANRENVKNQAAELRRFRKALSGSADDLELVSKGTQEIDSNVKTLEKDFKRLNEALGLENAEAQVDIYRQLEYGIISVDEATARQAAAAQENSSKQVEAIGEIIDALEEQKRAALDKDNEDKANEINDKIVAQQTKLNQAQLKGVQARIKEQNRLEKKAIADISKAQDKALKQVELAEQNRLSLINQSTSTEKQRALAKAESDRVSLQAQLQLNQAKQSELSLLEATGEEAKALEKEKVDAQLEGAKIANQIIENEKSAQQAALNVRLEAIAEEKRAAENLASDRQLAIKQEQQAFEDRAKLANQLLGAEIQQQQAITQSLQNQSNLLQAQGKLRQAQSNLQATRSNIEIDRINQAIELRRRLNSESLAPEVRKAIRLQLRELGAAGQSEAALIKRRFSQENQLARIKAKQFQAQQAAELQALQLAQKRIELEVELGRIKAQQASAQAALELQRAEASERQLQAQIANQRSQVELAEADLGATRQTGTREQIREQEQVVSDLRRALSEAELNVQGAQTQIDLERQNLELTERGNQVALEELQAKKEIGELGLQTLKVEQQTAKAQQDATESARKMAQSLQRAEAAAGNTRGIAARATGGPVTQGQAYLVGEVGPELFLPNRSGQIVSAAQLQSLAPPSIQSSGASSRGLEQRVDTLIQANRSLNSQILRLASRQPLQQQNYNYYGSSSRGLDLRGENL